MSARRSPAHGAPIASLLAACLLSGCEPTERDACLEPASKIELWANGTCLRGAGIYQRRVYPEYDGDGLGPGPVGPPYTADDFAALRALGANVVDISHPGIFTEAAPFELDEAVLENLEAAVDRAAGAGLFAVISFRTGPGRNEFAFLDEEDPSWIGESLDDESLWQSEAAQDAWVAMWRATAALFRDHRAVVAYDVMVEPNSNELVGAYAPQEFYPEYGGTLYDWNRLAARLVAAIREVDAETPILVGALGWSDPSWLDHLAPIDDARTVYAVHQYQPNTYTSQAPDAGLAYPGRFDADGDGAEDDVNLDRLLAALEPIDAYRMVTGAPVAVNEFGTVRWAPGAAAFVADEIDALEQLGTGWAIWMWYPSFEPWRELDDYSLESGPDAGAHDPAPGNDLLRAVGGALSLNTIYLNDAVW
jgi:hypothetical protein